MCFTYHNSIEGFIGTKPERHELLWFILVE
jgi:hypothetical protein